MDTLVPFDGKIGACGRELPIISRSRIQIQDLHQWDLDNRFLFLAFDSAVIYLCKHSKAQIAVMV